MGGGTDLPAYYEKYGGAVVNLTIDKYIYIAVNKKFDDMVRVSYSKTENVKAWNELEHSLVRHSLELFKIKNGIEVVSMADIPGQGSGLGSSSSFTVGLLKALRQYNVLNNNFPNYAFFPDDVAELACKVEIEMCGKPIGKQDQYAAAYGGLNYMTFTSEGVTVNPIPMNTEQQKYLADHLMLFYIGKAPPSELILGEQKSYMDGGNEHALAHMHQMKMIAAKADLELREGNFGILGYAIDVNWAHKRALASGITSTKINKYYNDARTAGAIGGKVCGAGGGGFMLFFAPPKKHKAIKKALPLKYLPIAPEMRGSRVIHMTGLDD